MIKQQSSENEWEELWANATKKYSKEYIQNKANSTMAVIARNYDSSSVIGYSGGKDSLVLRHMCENCIDKPIFLTVIHENEFPSFETWLKDTAPRRTAYAYDTSLDLDFLNKHLSYLFPHDPKEKSTFTAAGRKPTFSWMEKHGFVKILTGKRTDDGNNCGKLNSLGCKQTELMKPHIISLNPLADWNHGELLAYIQFNNIKLPAIYNYPNGFRFGTHPWTERRRINLRYKDTFTEIMSLEPIVIIDAAKKLEIAKMFLEGRLDF